MEPETVAKPKTFGQKWKLVQYRPFHMYESPKERSTTDTKDLFVEPAFHHVLVYLGKKEIFISVSEENRDGKITAKYTYIIPLWIKSSRLLTSFVGYNV